MIQCVRGNSLLTCVIACNSIPAQEPASLWSVEERQTTSSERFKSISTSHSSEQPGIEEVPMVDTTKSISAGSVKTMPNQRTVTAFRIEGRVQQGASGCMMGKVTREHDVAGKWNDRPDQMTSLSNFSSRKRKKVAAVSK